MRDLVQKLPSGNPQRDHGTSDDTIAAVLATLNEVIKKHPEFSRSVISCKLVKLDNLSNLISLNFTTLIFPTQVVAGGGGRGPADERDAAAGQVQLPGGQVREPGPLLHVAAPGAAGRVQEGGLEGGRLRDQDDSCPQREAEQSQSSEQYAEQASDNMTMIAMSMTIIKS